MDNLSPIDPNDSPLGRGLESLIPKTSKPVDPPSQPTHSEPRPDLKPEDELPAPPERKELPSHEEPKELPAGEPVHANPVRQEPTRHSFDPDVFASKNPRGPKQVDAVFHIEVEKIEPNPDQPRRVFEPEALRDLANSIREFGLLQPIVVTKVETDTEAGTQVKYVLISGERRLMACKLLGLERVPAIIRQVTHQERLELAIIENIQREQLNPIETARAMARLQDEFRMTQREIAVRLGKSRESIANTIRLLDLPTNIQEAVNEGRISESHGRMLLAVEEPSVQQKLFKDLLTQNLTTRELKNRVEAAKPKQQALRVVPVEPSPELKMLQEKLSSELGAPVKIQQEGESGKITISFYSAEELKAIADKLSRGEDDRF